MDGEDCGSNPMVSCPYNPVHQVKRSRLQAHILKCQKNYPHFVICPYNATHRFTEKQMKEHLEKCPNKSNTVNIHESENSIRSYSRSMSSVYPDSLATSSVCVPSLDNSSGFIGSVDSGIRRPFGLCNPGNRRPLRETDPHHEIWDD